MGKEIPGITECKKEKAFNIEVEYIEGLEEPYKSWVDIDFVKCYFPEDKVFMFSPLFVIPE